MLVYNISLITNIVISMKNMTDGYVHFMLSFIDSIVHHSNVEKR